MRLLRTIGGVDVTGQERAALNKLTMPLFELHLVGPSRAPCYVDGMEKVRIEADLPAALAAQARAFVAEGCATDLDDLLAEALRRYLESHAHDLTATFMKEDVQWGLHGDD